MADDRKQIETEGIDKFAKLEEKAGKQVSDLAAVNKSLKRKIFDLYTIFEISRHLNSVLDTESLLDGIILTIIGQMGVSGCAIFTVENNGDDLVLAMSKGMTLKDKVDYRLSSQSDILKEIMKAPNTAYNISTFTEVKSKSDSEVKLLKSLDCELIIPMSLKSRICGILIVTKKISQIPFYETDKDFLVILANQLSVAVENARLFESEKEAYHKLAKAQNQLVETEKLAALGQLSARVAHEVNNPLGIINNYLELMRLNASSGEKIKENVSIVKEEVNRIARIVRQLLDFYHPRAIEKDVIDLASLLDETMLLVSVQLESKGIKLIKKYPRKLPKVWASAEQLKQVFLNLIMNARDFMPDGGEIIIKSTRNKNVLSLYFADTGPGIEQKYLTRIFEPFFTTRKEKTGTGLGLSVCYGIIQNHGGTINVMNRKNGGAQFKIQLPVYNESNE